MELELLKGWETREFTPEDYGHWSKIWNVCHPDWKESAAEIKRFDDEEPPFMVRKRYISFSGIEPAAVWGWELSWDGPQTTRYYLVWHSTENARFSEVLPFLESELRARGASEMNGWYSSQTPETIQCALNYGFTEIARAPATRIDLNEFQLENWKASIKKVEAQGIRLTNILQLEREGYDWLRPLYESASEMVADMPRDHPEPEVDFEHHCKMFQNRSEEERSQMYVALDGDRIVGYSRITRRESQPGVMGTGLSGVVRSHRRRGIVTALKVKGITQAKQEGFRYIYTDNDARNPMYHLNIALGYRDAFAWVHLQKFL